MARRTPAIVTVADRLEPRIQRMLAKALKRVQDAVDLASLEAALAQGSLVQVLREIGLENIPTRLQPTARLVLQAYEQGGVSTADVLGDQLGLPVSFSITNPYALNWMAKASASLVTGITDDVRVTMREVLSHALRDGIDVPSTARLLRPLIGLTERQAMAVINYRFDLLEQGRSADDVARLAQTYSRELLNYRSKVIARTEAINASHAGQQETWRQAVEQGLLDPSRTERQWIVTHDDRLCPICEPMDGQTVRLEEAFHTGDGAMVMHPPAHPQCRCAVGLRFASQAVAA